MMESLSRSTPRRFIAAGLVLAAVITAVAVWISLVPTGASTSTPDAAPSDTPAASPSASASPSAAPGGPAQPSPAPAPGTPSSEAGPGDPAVGTGALVVVPVTPLASGRVVDSSALDRIVAGFPAFIPLAEKSAVLTSSVSSSGTRLQATLDATSELAPNAVADFYRSTFAALSLVASDAQASGGSTGTVFSRGGDSVTLTVSPSASGSRYSLFGVIDLAP